MGHNIRSLNPLDFTKVLPTRNEVIDKSEAKKLPSLDSYKANQIAKALHPAYQLLEIMEIKEEIPDVKTFKFKRKDAEKPAYFSAGQYITIMATIEGKTVCRPYSLSSSPKESTDGFYTITVKRTDGGLVSNYILDNWKIGDEVIASAPLGFFTYEPLRDAKHVVGLAGGSGITPFFSLAKAIRDGVEDCSLTLIYGSKTLENAIFFDELKAIEKECPKIKVVLVLSDEEKDGYEHGFISADLIKKYAGDDEYSVFICGPQAMYNFVDKEVEKLGLRKKFIRHEVFGEVHNPETFGDYVKPDSEEVKISVKMYDEVKEITANVNDTILASLEKNGVLLVSDCRSGICGWCHSQLISGKVYVPKNTDGRRMADLKFGYIHPCISYPLSDLVIDIPAKTF